MNRGAIIRGDTTQKKLALVFTGDEFADGSGVIEEMLQHHRIKASFFFTGRYYQNTSGYAIRSLKKDGHYLGAHSDAHLLYCDWNKRDSLLVTKEQFTTDLLNNYKKMAAFGITQKDAPYFLPPYEWYNDTIAKWTQELGFRLINFTPGTLSHADYTTPEAKNYRSSEVIYKSITDFEQKNSSGLNGFILLVHIGTDPARTDKFYERLPQLISWLKRERGYQFVRIDELLK